MFKVVNYKGRSIWKGFYLFVFSKFYFLDFEKITKKNYVLGIYDVGINYRIYNGKFYISILMNYNVMGLKFGQFISTKRIGKRIHLNLKKQDKRKRNG